MQMRMTRLACYSSPSIPTGEHQNPNYQFSCNEDDISDLEHVRSYVPRKFDLLLSGSASGYICPRGGSVRKGRSPGDAETPARVGLLGGRHKLCGG
jgi:hypothetical protein